ncbi:MAG TPA: carboxypeptidase regulatory-like domain-containing protein [Pyrinomonadaceae bacterium]|jgi:outer membrane receptor for ferrienterochelin and colicin
MKSVFGRLLFSAILLSLLTFTFAVSGFAQDLDDVTISGKVADTNGAAIVGASVTATQIEKNIERTIVTDDEGRYRLVDLQPGTYKVRATSQGFGAKEQIDLVTIAGQNVQLDFSLAPAGVQVEQTVTIGGDDAPAVDTTRTVVGGTVTQREIEELPNISRNPLDLVFTLGGVTEEPLSTRDLSGDRGQRGINVPGTTPEEAGTFALSGGAAYSNNITIDGLDNNDDRTAGFRFQPSIESIAEVQVITNQFSAEYGRASGGRVNIRTSGGSNRFRGRAFMFFRDDNLNANTWNNNRRGIPRPPFTNYNPGFTFSGPIVRDKLFFFTAYEYDTIQEDTIIDVYVPVNNMSSFPLPAPTHPNQAVVSNTGANSILVAPYISTADTPAKKHIFSFRTDWNLNNKNNFTFSYQLGRSNDLRQFSGTNRLADALIGRVRNTDAFNATHNYVASANLINQFRFQYSRLRPNATPSSGAESPVILISGFRAPGETSNATQIYSASTTGSSDRKEDRLQFQDTLTYIAGSHSLKFGVDYQRVDSQYIDRFDVTGTYRFSNFFFFNANSVSSFQQNFNTDSIVKNDYYGVFAEDNWRAKSNLTITYGLRYEKETVISDNNNFGPRFSVAWNPLPKGDKTVIRFGAGIFYNRVLLRTIDDFTSGSQELRFDSGSVNVPTGTTVTAATIRDFLSTQFPNRLTLDTVVPVNATQSFTVRQLSRTGEAFRSIDPDIKIPESYQFNIGFEREIFKGLVFETNVTWNKTANLWREYNPNAPVLPANTTDINADGQITFTDYLLSINTGTTRFELGPRTDANGIRTAGGITFVNLNTTNNTDCFTTTSPICRAFAAIQNLRPLRVGLTEQQERVASIGNSRYLGATFELRNRYRKFAYGFGGSMRFVYTLSSLKDDGIVNTSEATLPGDFDREWSRSLLDRRHRIAFSGTFDTPKWLGGLRLSPIFRFGSSAPFNLSIGGNDRNLDDISNDRPNFSGNLSDINWRQFGSAYPADLANQFTFAPIGSPGNLPRNAGNGPKYYIFDLNVSRQFKFTERIRLRPSIEFGNILNMTVFSFGSNFIDFNDLNVAALQANPTPAQILTQANAREIFLSPTRTYRPRQIRIGMRFEF